MKSGKGTMLALAVLLLLLAVGVDMFWYRAQKDEVERLLAQREQALDLRAQIENTSRENTEILNYLQDKQEPGENWRERYAERDALDVLEHVRGMSGLRRRAINLEDKKTEDPFLRSKYYMSVTGTYAQQVRFVRGLEQALPLVTVESFIMEAPVEGSSRINLNVNATVLTLAGDLGE